MTAYLFTRFLPWEARAAACDAEYNNANWLGLRTAEGHCPLRVALAAAGVPDPQLDEDGDLSAAGFVNGLFRIADIPDGDAARRSARRFMTKWDYGFIDETDLPKALGVWRLDVEGQPA